MKTTAIATIIGVVIVLIVAGIALTRETAENGTDELVPQQDQTTDIEEAQAPSPFTQRAPDVDTGNEEASVKEEEETEATDEIIISVNENGFSPASVRIAAGTTVTFVNNGQALHWPASDLHPTHDALPGFDSMKGIRTGETYSYTFTQTGTWNFHDHLYPNQTGTITVE